MEFPISPTFTFGEGHVPESPTPSDDVSVPDSEDESGPSTSSRPVSARDRKRARKLADSQRKKAKKQEETEEEKRQRLKMDAQQTAIRRSQETVLEAAARRRRVALTTTDSRSSMTEQQREEAREIHSSRVQEARAILPEDVANKNRRRNAESKARVRAEESEDVRDERRRSDATRHAMARSEEPEAMADERREADAKRARKRRSEEPEDVSELRRQRDAERTATARASAASDTTAVRRTADRVRKAARRSAQLSIATSPDAHVEAHYAGLMDQECAHCGALFFSDERTSTGSFTKCCMQGHVKLDLFVNFPQDLKELFTTQTPDAKHFRENIRQYNNTMALGSMCAKMDVPRGAGPYCFRLHGQVYHFVGSLHPNQGEQRQFAQVFIMDTSMAAEELAGRPMNNKCSEQVFKLLLELLEKHNPFVRSFKTMHEVEKEEEKQAALEGRAERSVKMTFRVNSEDDQRRYQLPTATEVAVVFVGDDDDIPGQRSITIHQRGGSLQTLRDIDPQTDPMIYPLLFPTGQYGWHIGIEYAVPRSNRGRVSLREFYCFYLHCRNSFSPLFFASKLFQQYSVDVWTKCEQSRLNFLRQNQKLLHIESYKGLQDYVAGEDRGPIGSRILLPSSFSGSPRDMVCQYQDAMSIVARFGKPDYFVTMTSNPKWKEIEECLEEGQTASDRPDIVARVFNIKLRAMCDDLFKKKVLGEPVAWIHVVEFQKRGLPHAHMLIIMKAGSKPRTAADVDRVISAELPDKDKDPTLWDIVTKTMMHRPCGVHNPNSPCMRDGKCDKKYPKAFREDTSVDTDGFPLYRRRDDGRHIKSGSTELDNRHVVPFNRWLLLRYNCHINVEVCGTISSIKYLYKYVYKGTTRASVRIHTDASGVVHEVIDEIDTYLDTRYVCPPEALHHMYAFKMSDRSVSVQQLKVHLQDAQGVAFRRGQEEQALQQADLRNTTLTAFFELNKKCAEAVLPDGSFPPGMVDSRKYCYPEMPEHFTFSPTGGWKPRKTAKFSIGRMYFVSPRDRERYALRLLLLYTKGPTSFKDLLTVGTRTFESFVDAAKESGYLQDDTFYEASLEEAAGFHSARQLRGFFSTLLCFGEVNNALDLWEKFLDHFCEDYEYQGYSRNEAESMAYFDVFDRLELMKVDLRSWIDLPYTRILPVGPQIDYDKCEADGADMRSNLTDEQESVVKATLDALEGLGGQLFIDGPGGSGKTYVYNCIANVVQEMRKKILCVAWTGIAASLLPHGRTVASAFKLDINSGCRASRLNLGSADAKRLADVDLILWDEAPMSPKAALETVDSFFRDVTEVDLPFGGKTVVLGGDFRQVLPVMDKGGVNEQVANSIKKSKLWSHFKTIHLTSNMRLTGEQSTWRTELLSIGDGARGAPVTGAMEVPDEMKTTGGLASDVFGDILNSPNNVEELAKRAILTPRNKEALEMNNSILEMLPGTVKVFKSRDEVANKQEGQELRNANNFTTEFLNKMTPSGMPPHELRLKRGAIVMLLRNLDVKHSMCNGTRFIIEEMGTKVLQCRFVSGVRQGESVLIPKIRLNYEQNLPFVLSRLQFPIRLSFAMTINKSQGQTFDRIGLQLEEPIFSHGQLYVALSRTTRKEGIRIDAPTGFMNNIVFRDVL